MVAMETLAVVTLIALARTKVSAMTTLELTRMTPLVTKVLSLALIILALTTSVTTVLSRAQTTLDRIFNSGLRVTVLTANNVPRHLARRLLLVSNRNSRSGITLAALPMRSRRHFRCPLRRFHRVPLRWRPLVSFPQLLLSATCPFLLKAFYLPAHQLVLLYSQHDQL
jgi:hypothetical protein